MLASDRPELNINLFLSQQQTTQITAPLTDFGPLLQDKLGHTHLFEDVFPLHLSPYQLPRAHFDTVCEEIKKILEARLIEPSHTAWASPTMLVLRRMAHFASVSTCRLNKLTIPDLYPIPRVYNLIDGLSQLHFISTLDLTKSYWQVPMEKGSIQKTTFITPLGKYQFTIMLFGRVVPLSSKG